jgi:S1-C subfamily serine protease
MKKILENNKLLVVVIIATVFGMASGFVGEIVARVYLLENTFNVPFFTEIDFRGGNNNGASGLIIRNPKKVVVEQNEKVGEIVASGKESVVGIYKKKKQDIKKTEEFDLEDYYRVDIRIGEAFIVTSDGWLISNFTPKVSASLISTTTGELPVKLFEEYVVINDNQKVYSVQSIIVGEQSDYSFWKIDARDLPVRQLVTGEDVRNGQILAGIDIDGRVMTGTINDVVDSNDQVVKSTDDYSQSIELSTDLVPGFFFFNLEGGIVGFSEKGNKIEMIHNYIYAIDSILQKQKIEKVKFGIYYVDLSDLTVAGIDTASIGALIYENKSGVGVVKESVMERAGLQTGDIVIMINNIEIKNDNMARVLSRYKSGDRINIEFLRDGEKKKADIVVDNFDVN